MGPTTLRNCGKVIILSEARLNIMRLKSDSDAELDKFCVIKAVRFFFMWTMKTLIRLRGYEGRFNSSLGAMNHTLRPEDIANR